MRKSAIKKIINNLNKGIGVELGIDQADIIHSFIPDAKFEIKPSGNYKAIIKLKYS